MTINAHQFSNRNEQMSAPRFEPSWLKESALPTELSTADDYIYFLFCFILQVDLHEVVYFVRQLSNSPPGMESGLGQPWNKNCPEQFIVNKWKRQLFMWTTTLVPKKSSKTGEIIGIINLGPIFALVNYRSFLLN